MKFILKTILSIALLPGMAGNGGAAVSASSHFQNARSGIDGGGGRNGSASFTGVETFGLVSLTTHTSSSFQARSGLIPTYFYPGQVAGLFASTGPLPGEIYLQWVAPGNDGQAAGTRARQYMVRVSSDPSSSPALSDALFSAAASPSAALPSPTVQGGLQNTLAVNLPAGTSYYFAFRGTEADGLPGALSGGVTAYATITSAGVYAVTFTGISTNSFTLYWASGTSVSGYNPSGTQYLTEVSSTPAFSSVVYSTQTTSISSLLAGLDPNTTYYARTTAFGNAAASPKTTLGSTSTLAGLVQSAELVCRVSSVSATANWLTFPTGPSSITAEGYTFEVSTAPDFSGTILSSMTASASANALTISGMDPSASYYYRVGSFNWNFLPNYLTLAYNGNATPPNAFAGATGFKAAVLSWNPLPQTGSCAIIGYNLYRSTSPTSPTFTLVSNTTSTTLLDAAVTVGDTYYYQVTGRLSGGGETTAAKTAVVFVHSAPPLAPFGVKVASHTDTTVTLAWVPVPNYYNGVPFSSYQTPAADELMQYVVYRATAPTAAPWTPVAVVSSMSYTWTDTASGPQYFYQVQAMNLTDASRPSVILQQSNQNGIVVAPDAKTTLQLSPQFLALLAGSGTDPASAYSVTITSHPEDLSSTVLQSIEVTAFKAGIHPDPQMQLASLSPLQIHYNMNGAAVAAAEDAPIAGSRAAASSGPAQPVSPSQLSVFWDNGSKWMQLYGRLDAPDQMLNVQVQNLGRYQLRGMDRPASFNVDTSGMTNKFITPNGDGKNDNAVIVFSNSSCSDISGKIFDLKGAYVAAMTPGPVQPSPGCLGSLMWNGKAGGRAVPGGVYIYQITGEGKVFNGTLVVIK